MVGQFDYSPEIQGIANMEFCNPLNLSDPNSPQVCSRPIAMNVQPDNPEYGTTDDMYSIYGTFAPTPEEMKTPKMNGFVSRQNLAYGGGANVAREAIDGFSIDHVPIQYTLAKDNALVDEWYSSGPITTKPNRAFLTSGTSLGHGANDNSFFTYTNQVKGFNNTSMFEVMSKNNITWNHYYWGEESDAMYYYWVQTNANERMIHGSQFWADAEKGELPQFVYLVSHCMLLSWIEVVVDDWQRLSASSILSAAAMTVSTPLAQLIVAKNSCVKCTTLSAAALNGMRFCLW